MSNFSFHLLFSQNTRFESKGCFFPEFGNLESNGFSADQLYLWDNQGCPLPKMCASELVSSDSVLIFVAQRNLWYIADSKKIGSETTLLFFQRGKRVFTAKQRWNSAVLRFSGNVQRWFTTDIAINNSSVCLWISSEQRYSSWDFNPRKVTYWWDSIAVNQTEETQLEKQESSVNQHLFWLSLEKYSLYMPLSKTIAPVGL